MKLNEIEIFEGGEYDEATNTFVGLKGLGLVSENDRKYKPEAVQKAFRDGKYQEVVVYIDHKKGPRSYNDRIGVFDATGYEEGLVGKFAINPKHPCAEMVKHDIQNKTKKVGFSHSIEGNLDKASKTVDHIETVYSLDIVSNPATTKSFVESIDEPVVDTKLQEQVDELQKQLAEQKAERIKLVEDFQVFKEFIAKNLEEELKKLKSYKRPEAKPEPAFKVSGYHEFIERLKPQNKVS